MTGIERGSSGGPPWSVDLLADLQAGALAPEEAAELWPRVNSDPEALAVLEALETTQADLREFAMVAAPPMPAHFAARLDAAIAAESQARAAIPRQAPAPGHAPVISLDEARKRRNRRIGWGAGFLAAAAVATGIAFAVVPTSRDTGSDQAQQPPGATSNGPLNFKQDELGPQQLNAAKNQNDYGPFSDKQKLTACLTANGVSAKADPLGGRQVTVDGKPGTLLVLAHGAGEFRLLVVGPDCGPGTPAKLADRNVK